MKLESKITSIISGEVSQNEYKLILLPLIFSDSSILGAVNFNNLRYRYDTLPCAGGIKKLSYFVFSSNFYYRGAYGHSFEARFLDYSLNKYSFTDSPKRHVNFPFSFQDLETLVNKNATIFYIQNSTGIYYLFENEAGTVYRKTTLNREAEIKKYLDSNGRTIIYNNHREY